MTKPKLPQARSSTVIILVVCIIALSVRSCFGWHLRDTVLAAGLFLDVVGAAILAIPDIPTIHRYFFSGMVRKAVDHLKLERGSGENILVEPGTDQRFIRPLYIVENVSGETIDESNLLETVSVASDPSSEGFYELRQAFREGTNDSLWNHVYGFKVYEDEDGYWRTYILHNKNGEPEVKLKGRFQNPFGKIEIKLRQSDARFRRMGLSLLIAGFLLQGLSIIV